MKSLLLWTPSPSPVSPNRTEPNRTEPNRTEPNRTEPNRTEPNRTEPNRTEPNRTEPNRTEPLYLAHFPRAVCHDARRLLTVLAVVLALAAPAFAQSGTDTTCPDGGSAPAPTAVAVEAVPIVVASTTEEYFVLYVRHDVDGTAVEVPVLVKRGEAGTTTLAENVVALPAERYRVEKYLVADPADVDGDCIDDITELGDPVGMNPVNPAAGIDLSDGALAIPDRETFDAISLRRTDFQFFLLDMDTDRPRVYFLNAGTHLAHDGFAQTVLGPDQITFGSGYHDGDATWFPELLTPDGSPGVFVFWTNKADSFSVVDLAYTVLAASMPLLEGNLAFYMSSLRLQGFQAELPLFRESRVDFRLTEDLYPENFIALNPGEGYGLLRHLDPDDRPHPRNVVIYEALPNELPRVAGIISTVPQTPLSHVNLRAVQDGIPNAYIRDVLDDPDIAPLLGGFVRYEVTDSGWDLRATTEEVEAHYESSRPSRAQTPEFDLSVTGIKPLSEIGFEDWTAFGVKAANVAVLGTLGFPAGTVPDGFAVPFHFYDEFMKAHDFYTRIQTMLDDPDFQTNFDTQDDMLDDLRDDIKDAETPQWIIDALTTMHATYPEGQSLRYRSSTNNEDLPGFNGAGLYDSKTQKPEETEEDGIAKSLKQVFASLWTFRAFTERDFHRIDHLAAKMGVLVHPNYSDELANGVAVSFDPYYGRDGRYYVNTQVGEDLVTNPEAHSVPEEIFLHRDLNLSTYQVVATSNQVPRGELLMSDDQLDQLRRHLIVIHDHFERLYDPPSGEPFAMEIEFKITEDNILAIKQARPWVFSRASPQEPPPPPPPPPPSPPPAPPPSTGGSPRVRDQHGDTPASASVVPVAAPTWTASTPGQINPGDDVDYFTLSVPQAGVLVVETTGPTATVGTVWRDGEELATASAGGAGRNFRLSTQVAAGPVVIAVAGPGRRTGRYTLETRLLVGYLENPGPHSFQSGIGLISGWVCEADKVEIEIETERGETERHEAGYGTARLDTAALPDGTPLCGDTDNGFGLLFNWNRLGEGEHTVVAWVDGVELGRAVVTVTTVGEGEEEEFLRDVEGECVVEDFPMPGETVRLEWQQNNQNFVITSGTRPAGENRAGVIGMGYLENPGPDSFQSGIGLISGWVCEAEAVEIAIGAAGRQGAAYGTERLDTAESCGDTDNGFGVLFNWNRLGAGEHEVVASVDGVELGWAVVRVTTVGEGAEEEFLRGVAGECVVADFPRPGQTVTVVWQESSQNFVITDVE